MPLDLQKHGTVTSDERVVEEAGLGSLPKGDGTGVNSSQKSEQGVSQAQTQR